MSQPAIILVTGFGPFGDHKINASWESVKLLPKSIDNIYNNEHFTIVTEEIPVAYQIVDEKIAHLWQIHKPKLVVHVGVNGANEQITIETCAYRGGYVKIDCLGNKHATGTITMVKCPIQTTTTPSNTKDNNSDEEDCIQTRINVEEICRTINNRTDEIVKVAPSTNVGRYLCEYTYYLSLNNDRNRALFVHVPRLDQPYTAQQLADTILDIIKCALKQISVLDLDDQGPE